MELTFLWGKETGWGLEEWGLAWRTINKQTMSQLDKWKRVHPAYPSL